jgi:hypothetical protein
MTFEFYSEPNLESIIKIFIEILIHHLKHLVYKSSIF